MYDYLRFLKGSLMEYQDDNPTNLIKKHAPLWYSSLELFTRYVSK